MIPKKPHMTYCPGLEVLKVEYYKPEDLKIEIMLIFIIDIVELLVVMNLLENGLKII